MPPQLISIAILGTFSIFLYCQQAYQETTSPQEVEERTVENQELRLPPDSVLRVLRTNFGKLESDMGDEEIFQTLGLDRYRKFLEDNSRLMFDGAGGNWRFYIDDHNGYTLAFREFFGDVVCMLKLPDEEHWRARPTNAKPIRLPQLDLSK